MQFSICMLFVRAACVLIPYCLYDYRKDNRNATTLRYRPQLAEQWERVYAYMEEFMQENRHR